MLASKASETITLRGANPDQVRIYVDGVPVNIAAGGGVDISTLPIGDVERVEIYRGSAPLEFGESALGGSISITPPTPVVLRANARSGAGSFGVMFGDVSGGGHLGRLRFYVGVHGLSAKGDYQYRRVDLSRDFGPGDAFGDKRCITGLQRMRSEGEFTATIWGWGVAASYAYPGGMAIRKLVTTPLTVN